MTQVPEKVLSWLYGVLHEYRDPQRTYSDSARTLSLYPSVSPRTEVYTYENGGSALLLTLSGTLSVPFRGTTYRFPVKLWIPHAYPQEAPIAYVVPGKDMIVRPGQHVAMDGRVYHPYLKEWNSMWDRASVAEFLEFLSQVFAKEPPVISRAQQQQYQRPLGTSQQQAPGASYAPPQRPPKQLLGSDASATMPDANTPPPRPPKPGEEYAETRDVMRDGPPLPPLPLFAESSQHAGGHVRTTSSHVPTLAVESPARGYSNGKPPGPPPVPPVHPHHLKRPPYHDRSPVSPISPVTPGTRTPVSHHSHPPQPQYAQHYPPTSQQPPLHSPQQPQVLPPLTVRGQPQPYQPSHLPPQYQSAGQYSRQVQRPAPDLLSDPFDVTISGPSTSGPPAAAPPIPPNPEREHLLHAASTTLVQQAQQKVHQTISAMAPLQAQQEALRAAHDRLDHEIRQLEGLDAALSSNEAILHRSIQECDQAMAATQSKRQPPIDEVLIAPTMVANQLWTLCAEEAACREVMYVLQKAVDRGRISGHDFVRQMRGLGRECFLKMALARKCAKGLGLDVSR